MDIKPLLQKIFDRGVSNILSQNEQCTSSFNGECQYRAWGKKCVVGHTIDDDRYRSDMEGGIPYRYHSCPPADPNVTKRNKAIFKAIVYSNSEAPKDVMRSLPAKTAISMLLVDMQSVHDSCADPSYWPAHFRRVAKEHGLSIDAIPWASLAGGIPSS